MNKQEFEERANKSITLEDYTIIEYVYNWHPSISETEGKDQIALLYNTFGIGLIRSMVEQAKKAETIYNEIQRHKQAIGYFEEMQKALKNGVDVKECEIQNVIHEYRK